MIMITIFNDGSSTCQSYSDHVFDSHFSSPKVTSITLINELPRVNLIPMSGQQGTKKGGVI